MMYEMDSLVMYGIHGVCRVMATEERTVDRKKMRYLVLEPVAQDTSRFYVPMDNANAMAKVRPMLRMEELEALLASAEVRRDAWIDDESRRKQYYRELIVSGDRAAMLAMVRTLHIRKQLLINAGRKFHLCDENFLRDAQRLLSMEFSAILEIEPGAVGAYLMEKMET